MAERTDERTVEGGDVDGFDDSGASDDVGFDGDELGVDVDALTSDPGSTGSTSGGRTDAGTGAAESSGPGLRSRLRPSIGVPNPLGGLPSARSLALTLVFVVGAMFLGGGFLPLGDVGSVIGIAVAGFVLGLLSGKARYVELAVSGALAAAVSVVLGRLFLSAVANLAVPLAAVGAGSGLVAAVLGHYFGRDLRDGLTRDV